jgi:predicted flap endonuclease-1-like 5' DNA nuclease
LLGWWLWSRYKKMVANLEGKINGYKSTIHDLEVSLSDCKSKRADLEGDLALTKGQMRELENKIKDYEEKAATNLMLSASKSSESKKNKSSSKDKSKGDDASKSATSKGDTDQESSAAGVGSFTLKDGYDSSHSLVSGLTSSSTGDSSKSKAGLGASGSKKGYAGLKDTNLQIIEGVGPKMESILNENGIQNWQTLAKKSPADLRKLLDNYGDKYRIIDPKSWSKQAELAAASDWSGLVGLQKSLDGGKATGNNNTDAKVDKVMVRLGLVRKYKQDDLKVVEGIGPKIEKLMHEAGIKSWSAMAETSVSKLQKILTDAGSRYSLADPATWPKQADLANKGLWDELEEYQDYLQGGRG